MFDDTQPRTRDGAEVKTSAGYRNAASLDVQMQTKGVVGYIEIPLAGLTKTMGTCCLVAPGVVLTNYHVIPNEEAAEQATFIFDHEFNKVAHTYFGRPRELYVSDASLDFAFVALNEPTMEYTPARFHREGPLEGAQAYTFHHPGGMTKQWGEGQIGFVGPHYFLHDISTDEGSSGAPIFNPLGQVVGIHRGDARAYHQELQAEGYRGDVPNVARHNVNFGIAVGAIYAMLLEQQHAPHVGDLLARLQRPLSSLPVPKPKGVPWRNILRQPRLPGTSGVSSSRVIRAVGMTLLLGFVLLLSFARFSQTLGGPSGSPPKRAGMLQWKFPTQGAVYSSPTVVNGTLYIGSNDTNVYALNADTGQVKWVYQTGNWVMSSPTFADDTVFVGSWDHAIYALDAASGHRKWTYHTGEDIRTSAPIVVNQRVYIGSGDHNVYALDEATGQVLWTYQTGSAIFSSPFFANGSVYISSVDSNVYALDATNGRLRWMYHTGGFIDSSPIVSGDLLYIGSGDHKVYALRTASGQVAWTYQTGAEIKSTPCVSNGVVYIGSKDFKVYALNAVTGALIWTYLTGNAIRSSPIVSNGVLYIGSDDQRLYVIDGATGQFKWAYQTGGVIDSSPLVVHGIVYVGSADNYVYAIHTTP